MKDKGHSSEKQGQAKEGAGEAHGGPHAPHKDQDKSSVGGPAGSDSHRKSGHPSDREPAEHPSSEGGEKKAEAAAGDSTAPASEERFLRLLADFDNFRKRTARERDELYGRANEDLMRELIPVLDHMDLAVAAVAPEKAVDAAVAEGIRAVSQQLRAALGKFGLTVIEAEGKPFDPTEHEAVTFIPWEGIRENMVAQQTRKGYRMGERMLRPAHVIVSSGAQAPAGATEGTVPDLAAPGSADPTIGKG